MVDAHGFLDFELGANYKEAIIPLMSSQSVTRENDDDCDNDKASRLLEVLTRPLVLPCGAVLKNRIVKSCMSDSLAERGIPTQTQIRLYERWAEGGVGMSCVGEVQVDPRYPEKPGNLVPSFATTTEDTDTTAADSSTSTLLYQELTRRATIDGAHLWAQLGHAGALAYIPTINSGVPKGPSALDVPGLKCDGLSLDEIHALPPMYAATALQCRKLGFTGVLIHAGHGFLLSQFLSPLFNKRSDEYGGGDGDGVEGRCRLVLEILQTVRAAVGPAFPVGIRLNSTDQLEGGLTQDDALEVVRLLDGTSVDIIDISGGTYFPGAKSASDSKAHDGGPYFLEFARRARRVTSKPLILTGGFKKRQQALEVLESGVVDAVGLARTLALNPSLAKDWTTGHESDSVDPTFPRFSETVPGGVTAWFTMRLTAVGEDREKDFDMDLPTALKVYEERDDKRTVQWKEHFQL